MIGPSSSMEWFVLWHVRTTRNHQVAAWIRGLRSRRARSSVTRLSPGSRGIWRHHLHRMRPQVPARGRFGRRRQLRRVHRALSGLADVLPPMAARPRLTRASSSRTTARRPWCRCNGNPRPGRARDHDHGHAVTRGAAKIIDKAGHLSETPCVYVPTKLASTSPRTCRPDSHTAAVQLATDLGHRAYSSL